MSSWGNKEIDAAKQCLVRAEEWVATSATMMESVRRTMEYMMETSRLQVEKAKKDAEEARDHLKMVEDHWDVIDVDSESGSQLRKDKTKQRAVSLIYFDSGDSDRENEDDHSTFVVEGCGVDGINGTYRKCGFCYDAPMYSKLGVWKGVDTVFKIHRYKIESKSKFKSNTAWAWAISTVSEDMNTGATEYSMLYSNYADSSSKLLPGDNWRLLRKGVYPPPKIV